MKSALFINKKYHKLEGRFLPYLRLSVLGVVILLLLLILMGVDKIEDVDELRTIEDKIFSKIEKKETANIENKNGELKGFQGKVRKVKSVTGSIAMGPVRAFNVLEKSLPSDIKIKSLEYHLDKKEYRIYAVTTHKEQISVFLERLQGEAFSDVLLMGQQQSEGGYQFSILLRIS